MAEAASSVSFVDVPTSVIGLIVPAKQERPPYSRKLALISIVPVRDLQFSNVLSILVTLLGIVGAVVRDIQP